MNTEIIDISSDLESRKHFNMIIYGACGSGKTFFLQYLLLTMKYNSLYVLCGGHGEDYEIYRGAYPIRNNFNFEEIEEWAEGNIDQQTGKMKEGRYILVLDDIMGMDLNKGKRKSQMEALYSRFRHANVSVITITHHLKGLPPCVRNLCNIFVTTKFDKSVYEVLEETGALPPEMSVVPVNKLVRSYKLGQHQYAYFDQSGKNYKFRLTA